MPTNLAWRTITGAYEMSVEKWWNEISGMGKREKFRENPTLTPFRPPRNPPGVIETRTRDHNEGLTTCAKGPSSIFSYIVEKYYESYIN